MNPNEKRLCKKSTTMRNLVPKSTAHRVQSTRSSMEEAVVATTTRRLFPESTTRQAQPHRRLPTPVPLRVESYRSTQ
jgi:hypothetical protein